MKTTKVISLTVIATLIFLSVTVFGLYYLYQQSHSFSPHTAKEEAKIYLYGSIKDKHKNSEKSDKRKYEVWKDHYDNHGIRHLFLEIPYFSAQLLNLWMHEKDDSIISDFSEESVNLYKKIKSGCPETVFHGTDLGWWAFDDQGKKYLEYLKNSEKQDSEEYKITLQNIEEGKKWWTPDTHIDLGYRENLMARYFIREFDKIGESKAVGFFAANHCIIHPLSSKMAQKLKVYYGDVINTQLLSDDQNPSEK